MAYVSHRSFVHERLYGIDKGCASEWRSSAPRPMKREPSFRSTDKRAAHNGSLQNIIEPVPVPATAPATAPPIFRNGHHPLPPSAGLAAGPLDLHIVEQPKGILRAGPLSGDKFSFRVSIRLLPTSPANYIDLSTLFAVITLVGMSNTGVERPVPAGALTGPRPGTPLATSVSLENPAGLGREVMGGSVMEGHVQFEDLVISAEGIFRIRVTLLQMVGGGVRGGRVLQTVESDMIMVEEL